MLFDKYNYVSFSCSIHLHRESRASLEDTFFFCLNRQLQFLTQLPPIHSALKLALISCRYLCMGIILVKQTILSSMCRVLIVWAIDLLFGLFCPQPLSIFWKTHFLKRCWLKLNCAKDLIAMSWLMLRDATSFCHDDCTSWLFGPPSGLHSLGWESSQE